jgi:hypothetical protein
MRKKTLSDVSGNKRVRGQALIEIAIFGAIFLMIIGAMITYGLNYNYNQEAQMRAFRTAMKIASSKEDGDSTTVSRGSGTYTSLQERHIPDPMDPYGAGSVSPVMSSASVTRDSAMYATAVDDGSLPMTVFDHQVSAVNDQVDSQQLVYRTAGFRCEQIGLVVCPAVLSGGTGGGTTGGRRDIGVTSGTTTGSRRGNTTTSTSDGRDRPSTMSSTWNALMAAPIPASGFMGGAITKEQEDNLYMKYGILYGSVVDIGEASAIQRRSGLLRIVDSCAGEVIDYDSCYEQAVKIVDVAACTESCQRSTTAEIDCNAVCNMKTNPPNQSDTSYNPAVGGAWYAAGYIKHPGDAQHGYRTWYEFPALRDLFQNAGIDVANGERMGLRQGQVVRNTRSSQMNKTERIGAIQTVDQADWTTTTERSFVMNNNLGGDSYAPETVPMDTTWTGQVRETQTTPK